MLFRFIVKAYIPKGVLRLGQTSSWWNSPSPHNQVLVHIHIFLRCKFTFSTLLVVIAIQRYVIQKGWFHGESKKGMLIDLSLKMEECDFIKVRVDKKEENWILTKCPGLWGFMDDKLNTACPPPPGVGSTLRNLVPSRVRISIMGHNRIVTNLLHTWDYLVMR